MKKIALLVAALVVCLGVGSLATAAPKKKDFRSKVTIRQNPAGQYNQYTEGFRGRVKSRARKCERNRTVVLRRKGDGEVDRTRTNRRGRYSFATPGRRAQRGRYFAVAKRKNTPGPRDCRKARSRTVFVRGR